MVESLGRWVFFGAKHLVNHVMTKTTCSGWRVYNAVEYSMACNGAAVYTILCYIGSSQDWTGLGGQLMQRVCIALHYVTMSYDTLSNVTLHHVT